MATVGTWFKSQVCVREFKQSIPCIMQNWKPGARTNDFLYMNVLTDAVKRAKITESPDRIAVPDADWWKQLCASCNEKSTSAFGSRLLREKLVHSLSQRLAVEEAYRLHGNEIEKCEVKEPVFVLGLPRCDGHRVAHVAGRSGVFLTPTLEDTLFPAEPADFERSRKAKKWMKNFSYLYHPYMQTVRCNKIGKPDCDTAIQLQSPQSICWGLYHGLHDHMYKCLQEDQQPVYDHLKRVMKLWTYYYKTGNFQNAVTCEQNPPGIAPDDAIRGPKLELGELPFLIHSPMSMSFISNLHEAFPDMKVIWAHRALNQCIPSFCSSLAIHNAIYTQRRPTETQMASIGEQVIGLLGSGSEYAVDYLSQFPRDRMVHWSNREIKRSIIRLYEKTLVYYGSELDHYRKMQAIDGCTEYNNFFKPKHDHELAFFGLHEGIIGEAFEVYIAQFEEYAFEKRFGIKHQHFQSLSDTWHHRMRSNNEHLSASEGHGVGAAGISSGHYLENYYNK